MGAPLDKYLALHDPAYTWQLDQKSEKGGYTQHLLLFTSQNWRGPQEVNHTTWKHWLRITIPNNVSSSHALLSVAGGKDGSSFAAAPAQDLLNAALRTQSILVELNMVPNQPLLFLEETAQRCEDGIIAYTWKKFLETKDASWPLHLPMAKSIVRAMDCAQAYLLEQKIKVEHFSLLGESKRAWAAWIAAAHDPRISSMIPICCDMLNVKNCFLHHYNSYGNWSIVLQDYLKAGIDQQSFILPAFDELMEIEDPYSYRNHYTMPKYIINSAGDPFSPPDSSKFYFSDLPGPKYLRYIPNTGHNLSKTNYLESAAVFHQAIVAKKKLPTLSWSRELDGSLLVQTDTTPQRITLWKSTNEKARDFRFDFTDRRWEGSPIAKTANGSYRVALPPPSKGWQAFFVELQYDSGTPVPYIFTTEVIISPDTFPVN